MSPDQAQQRAEQLYREVKQLCACAPLVAPELRKLFAAELLAVQRETRENCAERVPTNWLHPFLTGTKAVIGKPPYNCMDIQNLLLKVAQAIRGETP